MKVNSLFLREIAEKNQLEMEYHGFSTGVQLLKYLGKKQLDIIFMDIDLGEESGIDLAKKITKSYPQTIIVFVTGHKEFMEEAFEMDAMGYLVKPYDIKRMEKVLHKSLLQWSALQKNDSSKELVITDENLKKKIKCKDILYIQRQQYKSIIVTNNKKEYHVYEPMTALYERIGEGFLRVNQSEIVNKNQIVGISGNIVQLKNNMEMSIGRTFRKELMLQYFGA